MNYVADTCVLIWYLTQSPVLPREAPQVHQLLEEANRGLRTIFISAITIVEIIYLAERRRLPGEMLDKLLDHLTIPGSTFVLSDLTGDVALHLQNVVNSSGDKLDMPDRIIATDALNRGVSLFTSDYKLRNSTCPILWQ